MSIIITIIVGLVFYAIFAGWGDWTKNTFEPNGDTVENIHACVCCGSMTDDPEGDRRCPVCKCNYKSGFRGVF